MTLMHTIYFINTPVYGGGRNISYCIMQEERKEDIWFAVRTFYCKEESVARYLSSHGIEHFIPQRYQEEVSLDGERKRKLVPAVHNLLFIKLTISEQEMKDILSKCPVSISVIRHPDTRNYYQIPNNQMVEFRAICDPNYRDTLYVDQEVAEARIGEEVRVVRGQFKGLKGKLVRYKNRFYLVIVLAGLGVMIHIPKWYCRKLNLENTDY